ncbi:MAG: hypothetical protein J0H57_07080 [Rhodospirillales bacterium]|nr:hypothetical protein [Rhodospirillales bacterium]
MRRGGHPGQDVVDLGHHESDRLSQHASSGVRLGDHGFERPLHGEPDAAARNYIPKSDDVLNYVDVVDPRAEATIHFKAPAAPGRYPFLCSFPGHWMVMNGVMTVE